MRKNTDSGDRFFGLNPSSSPRPAIWGTPHLGFLVYELEIITRRVSTESR